MKHTPLKKEEIGQHHQNRAVLYVNKGYREYGVLSHVDNDGIHIQFAMNNDLMVINTGELYLTEID